MDLQALLPVFCEVQRGSLQMVVKAGLIIYQLVVAVLPEVQLERERFLQTLAVHKKEMELARSTGVEVAEAVLVLLVQMLLQLVVSVAMEDQVRLRAHQLLMGVVVVVEVDPIPIRQLLVVQVVQVGVVPEQHQRNPHVFLKMELMEVRT
jgi:hypothetical protein